MTTTDPRAGTFRSKDAAKRFHDDMSLHRLALSHEEIIAGRFMAVKLADGSSDRTAYPSRGEAMRHQSDHTLCFYPQIPPKVISVYACDTLLWYARNAHDNGYRPDIDAHWHSGLVIPGNLEVVERFANESRRRHRG